MQIFTRLESAKLYSSKLFNKTYLPVNIYKYYVNDSFHIKNEKEKILLYKYKNDIKSDITICELQDYI